jgi:hypothetical protein
LFKKIVPHDENIDESHEREKRRQRVEPHPEGPFHVGAADAENDDPDGLCQKLDQNPDDNQCGNNVCEPE